MRLPLAFAVLLLASAQALGEEMGTTDDLSYWSDWSDSDQAKEELPLPLEHFLQRMARRPRPQQFFGLMGKRDAGYGQISHKSRRWYQHWGVTLLCTVIVLFSEIILLCLKRNWKIFRHKTDSFVGLMGKRSLNSGSSEGSIAQNYERRRK